MATNRKTRTLILNAVLIKHEETGGFTSYFTEFPDAVAEGDTTDEAIENLFEAVRVVNEYKNEIADDKFSESVYTQSLQLELA